MDCYIKSYKGPGKGLMGKLTHFAVGLRSRPEWHTEFQFSDRYGGVSFSSTMQDGAKCCRFKDIEYSHPERWTTHIIPMTNEEEGRAWVKAQELEGRKYDLIGLLSFTTKWKIIRPRDKWEWCTEAVCRLFIAAHNIKNLIPDELQPASFVFSLDWLDYERAT